VRRTGSSRAIEAISGGEMNCFDVIPDGQNLRAHVQYEPAQIPNYWRYAEEFTIGDRFSSSVYGPTFVEHFWLVASQTDRYVDNQRPLEGQGGDDGILGGYCDDPSERIWSFPKLDPDDRDAIYDLEEVADTDGPMSRKIVDSGEFLTDLAAGDMPAVSWLFRRRRCRTIRATARSATARTGASA
jgi:hypothetical protein